MAGSDFDGRTVALVAVGSFAEKPRRGAPGVAVVVAKACVESVGVEAATVGEEKASVGEF